MFGMAMLVGGLRGEAFDAALRAALAALGAEVLERSSVQGWPARYEWARARASGPAALCAGARFGEVPSLAVHEAVGQGGERFLVVDVRGPRSPLWSLGLARRLSARLGVWAATMVNDRHRGAYGFGAFYSGHTLEAAARSVTETVLASTGDEGAWFRGAAVEAESHRRFAQRSEALTGTRGPVSPADGTQVDVFALGAAGNASLYDLDEQTRLTSAEARRWFEVAPAPMTQAVAVDCDAQLGPIESYPLPPSAADVRPDGSVRERQVKVLALRGEAAGDPEVVLRALAATPAAATVVRVGGPHGPLEAWHHAPGAPWTRTLPQGFDALLAAYRPVTEAAERRPIAWDVGRAGR